MSDVGIPILLVPTKKRLFTKFLKTRTSFSCGSKNDHQATAAQSNVYQNTPESLSSETHENENSKSLTQWEGGKQEFY